MQMLGEQPLTIKASTAGVRIRGIWNPGNATTREIVGVIQPLTDRETQQLPEGWRTRAQWKLYTLTELNTVDLTRPSEGDRVVWEGLDLLVVANRNYSRTPFGMGLLHYKYVLIEPERTET